MKKTVALFLMLAGGMFGADRRNITEAGKKLDRAAARAMWASADSLLDSITFPQAQGIISVLTNGTQYQINFTATSLPAGSWVGGEIIDPDGEKVSTDTYYLANGSPNAEVFMELWNGAFPSGWPAGLTRFRMLVQDASGRLTEVNAFVPVSFCCTDATPQVNSIVSSPNGQLTITGPFTAAPMVGVNGFPAQVVSGTATSSSATGALQGTTVVVANPMSLNGGNGVLTLCDQSICSQTNFNIPALPTNGKG
jgi:hypothetical protein